MGFPRRRFQSEMSCAESDRNDRPIRRRPLSLSAGTPAGMRLRPLFFATLLAFAAWSAHAQDQAPPDADAARDRFEAGLADNCPQKQLQLLSARNLRDGLDSYVESLPPDLHDVVQKAENDRCSNADAGAACVNMADILAADQTGHMDDLAISICGAFLRCTDQGNCDYAR